MTAPPSTDAVLLDGSGGRRWRVRSAPPLEGYADAGDALPVLIRQLLAHRGVTDTAAARRFLGSPQGLTDPALMPSLDSAVTRLAEACERGETVGVYGDYDVDGVTATCVLVEGLRALGARPLAHLPDRFSDGYGLNKPAIDQLADRGATLLVTADTGTSAVDEIAHANSLQVPTIVIDHHTVPPDLPEAMAIVNPLLNGRTYGSEPAAVGVAYKVVHDLHDRLGRLYDAKSHHALVTLGTICDVAPLVAENRDLVRMGLKALAETERPGLQALYETAGLRPDSITVDTVGWAIGPRLNAAGRMAHARLALDLLLAPDVLTARPLAADLERLNDERRALTTEALDLARALVAAEADPSAPLTIVATSDISTGIVGLVAGRLTEERSRPAIVMQVKEDGTATASCRSVPGFNIAALLDRNADLFDRHGGHRAAAGFTMQAARIPELRERLQADAAEAIDTSDLRPEITVDAELPLSAISPPLLGWFQLMEPHGEGNRRPVFLAREVEVLESRLVGSEGAHLQMRVRGGGDEPGARAIWRCISFRNGEHAVMAGQRADLVYSIKRDDFRGGDAMQLEVLDLRPSTP